LSTTKGLLFVCLLNQLEVTVYGTIYDVSYFLFFSLFFLINKEEKKRRRRKGGRIIRVYICTNVNIYCSIELLLLREREREREKEKGDLEHGGIFVGTTDGHFGLVGSFTVVSNRIAVLEVDEGRQWVDAQFSGCLDGCRLDEFDAVLLGVVGDVLQPIEHLLARFATALLICKFNHLFELLIFQRKLVLSFRLSVVQVS